MSYDFGICLRSSSTSMRSLPRPEASLLRSRASRPMKWTMIPSSSPCTRVCQASSKLTPEIEVIRSIRLGSCPSWITRAGAVKSSTVSPKLPNPNSWMLRSTRAAFPALARTKKSMSAEYRGYPCQETASAPTTKYSTPFEFKHSTNSRKSLLSGIGVGSLPDREKDLDPFLRAHFVSRKGVRCVRFFKAVKDADNFLHALILPRPGGHFGFDRTHQISGQSAQEIADAARAWGQNDDITVVTVRRAS